MPYYLAPGVYVEEISTGSKPIEGVSTSVAGFVGPTERGPEDIRYVTSWLDYQRWYGGHLGPDFSFMSYAVQGFFDNGGQRCFIGRIVSIREAIPATLVVGNLSVQAVGRGAWGNRIFVRVRPATEKVKGVQKAVEENWIRVQVAYFTEPSPQEPLIDFTNPLNVSNTLRRTPHAFEDYDNLSIDPQASNSLLKEVNVNSRLVRLQFNGPPADVPLGENFAKLANGSDGAALQLTDYEGTLDPIVSGSELFGHGSGLRSMETIDEVSLLMAPDEANRRLAFREELSSAVVQQCERLKDRFAVLSVTDTFDNQEGRPSFDTSYGAQYYPWIYVYDPYTRDDKLIPPTGHVAGIMARTDLEQGVHKAPANAVVIGAKGLQKPVPKGDQDLLNPVGINCIRDFRPDGRGLRLWGARTMTSDPEWKYINVRRLFLFLEESIDEGTQWVVFEPNAPSTWARVQQTITSFLTTVWRNGALLGNTRDEAFFVRCDRTTMTQDDLDNGRLICYIGVAPVKPAEFVIFRIGQKTADTQS
jgi:uncharacterized protein